MDSKYYNYDLAKDAKQPNAEKVAGSNRKLKAVLSIVMAFLIACALIPQFFMGSQSRAWAEGDSAQGATGTAATSSSSSSASSAEQGTSQTSASSSSSAGEGSSQATSGDSAAVQAKAAQAASEQQASQGTVGSTAVTGTAATSGVQALSAPTPIQTMSDPEPGWTASTTTTGDIATFPISVNGQSMTGHLAEGSELIDSSYYFTYSDAGGNHTIYYGFADNDFSTSGVYLVDNSGAELSDVSHLSVTSVEVNTSVPNYTEVRAIATTDITVGEASVPIEVRVTMIPNSDGTVIHQYEIVNNGTQTLSGVHLVAGIDTDLTCDEGDAVPVYSLGTNEGMYISGSNSSQPVSVYFPVTTSDDSSYGSTPDNYAAWAWPSSASPSCEGCSFSGVQDALTNGSLWGVTHASGDQLLTGVDSAVQFGWASTDIAAGATSDFLYNVGLGFTVPAPTASVTAPNFSLYPGSDSTTAGPACDPDYVVFNNVDTQTDSTLVDVTLDNTAADFAGNLTGTIQFGTGYGATETYESTVYNLSFAADSNGTVHALVMADGDASPHGIRSFASFGTGDFAKITLNTTDATDGENIGYTVKAYDLGSTTATVPADADAIANLTSSLTSASTSSLIVSGSGNIYVASLPTLSAKDASLTLGTDGTMGLGFTANPTTASAQVSGYAVASGWGDQSGDALLTVTVANPTIARGLSGAYLDFGTGTDPVSLSQFDSTGQATASVPVADLEALSDGTFSLHAIPSVSGDTTYTVSLSYDVSGTTETIDSSSATLSIPVAAAKPAAPAAATPAAALPQTGDMTSLYVVIAALLAMVIGSALLMASRRKRNAMEGKRNNND